MDEYEIRLITKQHAVLSVKASAGASLLEICRQNAILLEADCNGNGTCGKCSVQVIQGDVPVTGQERRFFSYEELSFGYRLACQVKVAQDLTVRVRQDGAARIQTLGLGPVTDRAPVQEEGQAYNIAADLGSTTLAAALLGPDGTVVKQASAANPQRCYGADVISRIRASNESESKKEALQACICKELAQLFQMLLVGKQDARVSRIAVAGNTAMFHFLRGYSCERLGQAPFEPVNLGLECLEYEEVFPAVRGCGGSSVYLLPGLSAFIGADIASGLYSSGFLNTPEQELAVFLDLGTNGELAVGNRAGFVTASTAAGPVFEGGHLSCGIPAVPGAVANVSYLYHRIRVQTIGQKRPCGICGSGALTAVAALLQEGLLDHNGLLAPELFETGLILAECKDGSKIRLTQADIREIQMAKAAIRAGLEVLLVRYQEQFKDCGQLSVGRIYLAGGFGYHLSADTAAAIGLLPPEWKEKVVTCGNTSLKGAAAFLTDTACAGVLAGLRSKDHEIRLAEDPLFQESYIHAMQFP